MSNGDFQVSRYSCWGDFPLPAHSATRRTSLLSSGERTRRQKVQRSLRGQFPHPSAQQQAATEPNQAANSSMLRGRSSGSRSPPAPIGRFRERSATTKYHRPANLHSAPSMAEVPRYFPVLPGNSSRCHGKPETEGRQVPQPAGGGSRYAGRRHNCLGLMGRGFPVRFATDRK